MAGVFFTEPNLLPRQDQIKINRYRSLIIVLVGFILLIQIVPKRRHRKTLAIPEIKVKLEIESVPITRQKTLARRARPERPALPMPLEAETLPEYETFLPGSTTNANGSMRSQAVHTRRDTVQPRPVFQKMPVLDNNTKEINGRVVLLLRVGTQGEILDLVLGQNTTQSEKAAQAAIQAVRQSRFRPGTIDGKAVEMWMRLEYGFDRK
jgi:hypothetical protein